MTNIRSAKLKDIKQIQKIEKEYYEGFKCPIEILKNWIGNLNENFMVAEEGKKIIGFIFFEYLNEIKAIPFVHKLEHKKNGKFVYISEIGILNEFQDSNILQQLFNQLLDKAKQDDCKSIIWLTGSKHKHDEIESEILRDNNFIKKENVKNWEAYPNYYVNNHYIWTKQI